MMIYVELLGGFCLLLGGAEALVRGSAAIARGMGLSAMVIGMTVVAFGTSAPELVVSLDASLAGASGLAVGNIVGSNIANVLLIIGLTALCAPIPGQPSPMVIDSIGLLAASVVFSMCIASGVLDPQEGLLLIGLFAVFIVGSFWRGMRGRADLTAQARSEDAAELATVPGGAWVAWTMALLGLAGLLCGSHFVVEGGIGIARSYGVSEAVIGLTMVAVGTSLPELAASVVAAVRGHPDIAVGNVLGSNLFNMLMVGGLVAAICPLTVDPQVATFDIYVMLAATVLFLPSLLGRRFGRLGGFVLLICYGAYIAAQVFGAARLPW